MLAVEIAVNGEAQMEHTYHLGTYHHTIEETGIDWMEVKMEEKIAVE